MHATLSFRNSCRITLLLTSSFGIPAGRTHPPGSLAHDPYAEASQVSGLVYLNVHRIKRSSYTVINRNTARPPAIPGDRAVSYTHLRAHETRHDLVCRLL